MNMRSIIRCEADPEGRHRTSQIGYVAAQLQPAVAGQVLGEAGTADAELALASYEGSPTNAGPQIIANPADYIDAP
ncbi:hypothetical protein ABZ863_18775 [Saccharomonospora sp. NPDC046836]|uniref:hypothetical protein n=1 Tax=Saccharomonospora sp. NPDC046836 TaxID=3156921 RepID=UPI0033E7816A